MSGPPWWVLKAMAAARYVGPPRRLASLPVYARYREPRYGCNAISNP